MKVPPVSGFPDASLIEPALVRFRPSGPLPVPVPAVTVQIWPEEPPPTACTFVINVPARLPPAASAKFSRCTPLTGSLNATVQVTLDADVGVGAAPCWGGTVSIERTIGAEPVHGPKVTVIESPPLMVVPPLTLALAGHVPPPAVFTLGLSSRLKPYAMANDFAGLSPSMGSPPVTVRKSLPSLVA